MLGSGGRHNLMESGRRRRAARLRRRLRQAAEPRSLLRGLLVAVALVVIAASLVGPPSGAAIVRPDFPLVEAQIVEEPADELAAWASVPSLSVRPRFELALPHQPIKRVVPPEPIEPPAPATTVAVVMPVPPPAIPMQRPAEKATPPAAGPTPSAQPPAPPPPLPTATLATTLGMVPNLHHRTPPRPADGAQVALVIDDLGPAVGLTHKAIELPRPVTLAFLPYAQGLPELTAAAKQHGHEVYLHLPMEPIGNPDPGPNAILVGLDPGEFSRRLNWAFERVPLATGVNNHMGSRATSEPETMLKVLQEVRRRGLSFVDSRTSPLSVGDGLAAQLGIPHAARDVFLDNNPSTGAIQVQLALAERLARRQGHALAIGHPYPTTLAVLARWIPEAEARGVKIVRAQDLIAGLSCRPEEPLQASDCRGAACAPPRC